MSRKNWRIKPPKIQAANESPTFFMSGGSPTFTAATGNDGDTTPTFEGIAYTGAPMSPGGFGGQIICDLDGFEWAESQKHPALHQHDAEQVVGHTTKIAVGKGGLAVSGVLSGEPENVKKVRGPHSRGFPWQMSIGATPTVTEFIEPGEKVTVNGREVVGPITRSRKTKLSEVSFVPNGADDQTSATVQGSKGKGDTTVNHKALLKFAKANGNVKAAKYNDDEIDKMDEEKAKAALKECMAAGDDPDAEAKAAKAKAKAAEDEAKAAADEGKTEEAKAKARALKIAAEEERHDAIRAAVRTSGITHIERDGKKVNLIAAAIGEGWGADKVELEILRASRASAAAGAKSGPHLHFASEPLKGEAVIEAALFQGMRHQFRLNDESFYHQQTPDGRATMRRVPQYLQDDAQRDFKAKYTEQVQDSAHKLYKGRLGCHQLFQDIFAANGSSTTLDLKSEQGIKSMMAEWAYMDGGGSFRASGTATMNIANILANVLNKFALQGYLYVEGAWRQISSIRSFNDFKPTKSINLLGDTIYKDFGPNGEIDQASIGDQAFANQASPYGRMITIPWTYIVNDDLSMLSTIPMKLGQGAGNKVNDVFWTLWAAMMAGTINGDDGNPFWRTTSSTTTAAKKAGTAYLPNKTTGALSATTLSAVRALYENQIDPNGNPLGFDGMKPILLFGPSNWQTASALLQSPAIVYGGSTALPSANIWQGYMTPVQSKYIENASYGNSTTAFFALFDPVALPVIETGFLTGMDSPAVLTAGPDYQFDRLGISIRGTQAFGVAQQNFRGGVYCTGA